MPHASVYNAGTIGPDPKAKVDILHLEKHVAVENSGLRARSRSDDVPMRPGLADIFALGKPRLSSMVLFTAGGGMWLAPGSLPLWRALFTVVAIFLLVMSANTLNCYLERDSDALMHRTRGRPLPARRVPAHIGLWLGIVGACVTVPAIAWAANPLTAVLGAFALIVYVNVYTPMKKLTAMALAVGAIPGAMPPLMGWTAVTNGIHVGGLSLFALLLVWQLPHFLAVSYYLKDDYLRGGHRVFAAVYGKRVTVWAIVLTSAALIPVALWPVFLGITSWLYGGVAIVLGLWLTGFALKGLYTGGTVRWARSFFLGSLVYLCTLFFAIILDIVLLR